MKATTNAIKKLIVLQLASSGLVLISVLFMGIFLGLVITALGINLYAAGGIVGTIFGLLPYLYMFLNYKANKNEGMSVLRFYLRFMIVFAIFLLLLAIISVGNGSDIPVFFVILYFPQIRLWEWLLNAVNNVPIAYLLIIIFYSVFFFLAVFINDGKNILNSVKRML